MLKSKMNRRVTSCCVILLDCTTQLSPLGMT